MQIPIIIRLAPSNPSSNDVIDVTKNDLTYTH